MSFLLYTAAIVLLFFLTQWYLKRKNGSEHLKKLPCRRPMFLIGNLDSVIKSTFQKLPHRHGVYVLERFTANYKLFQEHGLYVHWMFSLALVDITAPELFERILSNSTSLEKTFPYKFLHKWMGLGLLTSSGSRWRSRRKLITPAFHFRILEDFFPVFNDQSMVLVSKIKTLMDEGKSVDIVSLLVYCTLDVVCESVMGVRIGAQNGDNLEYVAAVQSLAELHSKRASKPWLYSDLLYYLTSDGKAFKKYLSIMHGFTLKVIREKKEAILKRQKEDPYGDVEDVSDLQVKKRKALMDLLLEMHLDGEKLQEQDVREEIDTFMFAGHDTTSLNTTYTLHCIGLYPDVQRKVFEELDAIFGDDVHRPITVDDARNMKYLECVIKESLRIYPSAPAIGRILNEDIHYRGMVIPKGTNLRLNIYCLHRNPENYPNPEVFDPERFTPDNCLKRHPYAFLPFSAGPRNCIGQKYAMMEEKVLIANILRNFQVSSLDHRDKIILSVEFTLKPTSPIRIQFTPRR